jgi:hypothetical protein
MSESNEDAPLEELMDDAEQTREQFVQARDRLQKVRKQLRQSVEELSSDEVIDQGAADRILALIDDGKYGEAREAIREAQSERVEFEDAEKESFAVAFETAWGDLESDIEQIRTSLLDLQRGIDNDDIVDYLYGKHSGLRKSDIREVFEAFSQVERTGLSTKQAARVLAAYNSNLQIRPTTEVLDAIKEEARRR